MISIILIAYGPTDGFAAQFHDIKTTIGVEHEILCAVLETDIMREWYVQFLQEHGARFLILPDLGFVLLTNILATRASGAYILCATSMRLVDADSGWGERAITALSHPDKIGGALISKKMYDHNISGLLITTRTFHVLGYYSMPLFQTLMYGARWAGSALITVGRFVNIPSVCTHARIGAEESLQIDEDLYNVTSKGRLGTASRLQEFMETKNE